MLQLIAEAMAQIAFVLKSPHDDPWCYLKSLSEMQDVPVTIVIAVASEERPFAYRGRDGCRSS